ncbi:MAG: sigma-70 family RNA polymerase sigma factor [Muribaculaceae bacterium]|nr:sigma-70 family RNA polymerase sigma factor [Muribaculaceae bacterium]MDE6552231.1 sigma-70 family RNA polymerase sigma factor [Muribaculaceae bacterium]
MQYSDSERIFSDVRHLDLDIDNETLVKECRSGDRDAMSILYSRFAPRMLRVISRYVSDRDSSKDILHDGFIAAFTRIDTLRQPENLEFWLATIMKNLSLKFLQAQSVNSILEEIPETIEEPPLEDILDFATLESLIRKLPEGYRKVFRLAVLEGKTHKEISEILGIAPNSSSSQLFHAKVLLRRLIRDYQLSAGLISLLLLIVASGLLFISRKADDIPTSDRIASESGQKTPESRSDGRNHHRSVATTARSVNGSSESCENETYVSPTLSDNDSLVETDSVGVQSSSGELGEPVKTPLQSVEEHHDNASYRPYVGQTHDVAKGKGWSAGILFDPGMISFSGASSDMLGDSSIGHDPIPPQDPENDKDSERAKSPGISRDVASILGRAPHSHHLPISFALTAEKRFSSWFGLESGLGYSYLHTDFELNNASSTCHWNYLEIPLKANFYANSSSRLKFYGSLGGRVAVPVYSYAHIAPNPFIRSGSFNSKTVWSVGGSVGVAFSLSKRVDIFVEPTLRYNFPQDAAIPNIWTDDEPWSISIPIGFRFSW